MRKILILLSSVIFLSACHSTKEIEIPESVEKLIHPESSDNTHRCSGCIQFFPKCDVTEIDTLENITDEIKTVIKNEISIKNTDFVTYKFAPLVFLYPEALKRAKIEGTVDCCIVISRKGEIKDILIIQTTNRGFIETVEKSVKNWKYEVDLKQETYSDFYHLLRFNFSID